MQVDSRSSSGLRIAVVGGHDPAAIRQVLAELPEHSGLAVVVSCAGSDDLLSELQGDGIRMPIADVRGRTRLEPDRVFVVPPGHAAWIERGEVIAERTETPSPIDRLLRSAADEHGRDCAGVLLAGRGSDGTIGIKRLKEAGGLTIAQQIEGDQSELPRSAIATGMIDLVLRIEDIAQRLTQLTAEPAATGAGNDSRVADSADTLRDILALVRIRTGHDFASYKRATLYRRVSRRMQVCQCATLAEYQQYVREHPAELAHLLRDFLISVTNFFRDKEAFEALERHVIPRLFAGKTASDQIRVWVPGCATGEEAYSLAILLAEHANTMTAPPQLQIFATDIDEASLAEARSGRYPETIEMDVSRRRLESFFGQEGSTYRVGDRLREMVLFSPHNLIRDPPFSRLDLVSCRNLLIYFNRDAQDRVLNIFHFAMKPDGFLLLGSSESAENSSLFAPLDMRYRLFTRRIVPGPIGVSSFLGSRRWEPPAPLPLPRTRDREVTAGELHHELVEQLAPPSILVNEELEVAHISSNAGRYLHIEGGEPTRELFRLINPALRVDLRTVIHAARQAPQTVESRIVDVEVEGRMRSIELRVRATDMPELGRGGLLIMFEERGDTPATRPASSEASGSTATLEPVVRQIELELRRTREQLRLTVEQYETSVEELRASNEELQAINEELRSATEELETGKEELQSVNEELITLNHELKVKLEELSHANADLQNLMTSTEIGVFFLDRLLTIKRFTPRVQEIYNVIATDIGRPFAHLTHRLTGMVDLVDAAKGVVATLRTSERELRTTDGRRYLARLLPYRSLEDRIEGVVVTFVDVTDLRNAIEGKQRTEAALAESEARLQFALRSAPLVVIGHGPGLDATWGHALGSELGGTKVLELFAPGQAERYAATLKSAAASRKPERAELDLLIDGQLRTYDFRIEPTTDGAHAIAFDITPSKLAETVLLDADRRKDEFLATLSHELRNPLTPLKVALDVARVAKDPEQLAKSREIMERQVAMLESLVNELLDLSRITQGRVILDRKPLDVAELVEAALEVTRPLIAERDHKLRVGLPETSVVVVGDRSRLIQVLTNLLNNAAKYTPPGGEIDLVLSTDRSRKKLVISVRDTGYGIAAEMLQRIFDIFVQSRDAQGRSQGGLGIGLNLVRRLVALHGGSVTATSDGPDRGSEFVVELPLP